MGYRSQVAFVIRGPKDAMVAQLTTYRLTYEHPEHTKEALDACTYTLSTNELTVRFHAEDIKWYESYESVAALTALFDAFREVAEEPDGKINGCFMRVGENDDDIESSSYGADPYDLVRVHRTLEIDCDPGVSLTESLATETA